MPSIVKPFTNFTQTDIFLTAAEQKGWSIDVFFKKPFPFAEIRKKNLVYRICGESISLNSNISAKISKNKYLTHLVLKKFVPHFTTDAHLYRISKITETEISTLLKKHRKLVVKPVDENNGIGVTTALTDISSVLVAIELVRKLGAKTVLIENHVEIEKEYRVIMWKGKALDILLRIPAYIVGDGKKAIQTLIKEKNDIREHQYAVRFNPIDVDQNVLHLLQQQGLQLDSILEKSKLLQLKLTCNFSRGGEVKRVNLDSIHPLYNQLFENVYNATWQQYCGLDLITPDITQAPIDGKTVVNELNGGPQPDLAFYDDLITDQPFAGMYKILEKMEFDPVTVFAAQS